MQFPKFEHSGFCVGVRRMCSVKVCYMTVTKFLTTDLKDASKCYNEAVCHSWRIR